MQNITEKPMSNSFQSDHHKDIKSSLPASNNTDNKKMNKTYKIICHNEQITFLFFDLSPSPKVQGILRVLARFASRGSLRRLYSDLAPYLSLRRIRVRAYMRVCVCVCMFPCM